ncbi:MAG: DUF5060 domain-containing protein [bacterium]
MKLNIGIFCLMLIFGITCSAAVPQMVLFDSFEDNSQWKINNFSDPGVISQTAQNVTEGKESLKLEFKNTGKEKAAISRETNQDLSEFTALLMDITNATSAALEVAVAFQTGGSWEWFESKPLSLKPRLNKNLRIDLTKSHFKCSVSDWKYTEAIGRKNQLKSISILIFPKDTKQATVYLDNLRFEKAAAQIAKHDDIEQPSIMKFSSMIQISAPKIIKIIPYTTQVKKYSRFEAIVQVIASYNNPFDPNDIALDARFTSPSGKQYNQPGFLYAIESSSKGDIPIWKVRFAPNELGNWTYTITVNNQIGIDTSTPHSFLCQPSENKGYIQINKQNPIYFQFENGDFYYPIGANVAWAAKDVPGDYQRWLPKYATNGANFARIWMSSWGHLALEWKLSKEYPGLGLYSLKNAQRLDKVIEIAERNDIYVQLVLNYHGQFSSTVNPNWDDNPYNSTLGGPLKKAEQVFTNEKAKQLFKQRYRYIVARWGYSPNIMAWELWNEVKFTDNYNEKVVGDWHQEMGSYLKSIDPTKRLITSSYADGAWDKPAIDYVQIHMYIKDLIGATQTGSRKYEQYHKPVFFGELGSNAYTVPKDAAGIDLHNSLWSSAMTNQAGAAMFWSWDNYIEPYNLYHQFQDLAHFIQGIDRGKLELKPISSRVSTESIKYVDVTFGPVLGWEASTKSEFIVGRNGTVTNIDGLSSYFQGPRHQDMRIIPVFKLDCIENSQFILKINQVSGVGAGLTVYVDDTVKVTQEWQPTPDKKGIYQVAPISVNIPIGKHIVKVDVDDGDWIEVGDITITNYALSVRAYGIGDLQHAYLWVRNQEYTPDNFYAGKLSTPINHAKLEVQNLLPRSYTVEYWDTYTGKIIQRENKTSTGSLLLELQEFDKDIAVKIF